MGDNVVPRQDGDAYQAMVFWLYAGKLFQPHTHVEKISWESSTTGGFDDVVVHYTAGAITNGMLRECISVKHHVDHRKSITHEALIDPEFINSKKATILSRLYDAFKADPDVSKHSVFRLVNTWVLDPSDALAKFIKNDRSINLEKLFDGTGDSSQSGKIRKAWREHLGVNDDVLRNVLRPLRIDHSYDDISKISDRVSDKLLMAKLQPIDAGQRHTGYVELIQRLHSEGKKEFTKEQLFDICRKDGLVILEEEKDPNYHVLGVRSFRKGAEDLGSKVVSLLCLLDRYTGRYLNDKESWQQINSEVQQFAENGLASNKQLKIYLDTHLSLAFSMGYALDIKTGAQVTVIQNTLGSVLEWKPNHAKLSQVQQPVWEFDFKKRHDTGADLVIAISATHDVLPNVDEYVESQLPGARGILSAVIVPQPSTTAFQSAEHIVVCAQSLVQQIRQQKVSNQGVTDVHLFLAAPNAFAFFLGQLSKPIGRLHLYEYDFEGLKGGSYHPCITLPTT